MWFTWGGKGPHHTLFCRGNIKGELHIKTMNTAWLLGCFYDWAIVICAIVQKKLVFEFTKQLFGLLGSCPAHVFFSSRPANIQISKPKWLRLSITRWWRSRQSKNLSGLLGWESRIIDATDWYWIVLTDNKCCTKRIGIITKLNYFVCREESTEQQMWNADKTHSQIIKAMNIFCEEQQEHNTGKEKTCSIQIIAGPVIL